MGLKHIVKAVIAKSQIVGKNIASAFRWERSVQIYANVINVAIIWIFKFI